MKTTEITYSCICLNYSSIRKPMEWEAIVSIINEDDPHEFSVRARGSVFQVIVGRYEYGMYICIPNYNIGCDLPNGMITDHHRIAECLTVAGLSSFNAISIAYALKTLRWRYGDLLSLLNKSNL